MVDTKANGGGDEPALLLIDSIYDALDAGEPEGALALARDAIANSSDDDPVVRFLAGISLMELDRPGDAVDDLRRAVALDEDDAEARAALALALFRSCAFDEAREAAEKATTLDPDHPDASNVQAMLAERRGDYPTAEAGFRRAAELDPMRFPVPVRMERAEFDEHVAAAIDRLPEAFRKHLDRVAVTVDELPSTEVLTEESPALDPELLGLFVGLVIADETTQASGDLPPRILIFKRNLERFALERDELVEEIAVTLYHELGHYLGLDEDELEEIDLA